jgi:hypothetical protein
MAQIFLLNPSRMAAQHAAALLMSRFGGLVGIHAAIQTRTRSKCRDPFVNEEERQAHIDWLREGDRIDDLLKQADKERQAQE